MCQVGTITGAYRASLAKRGGDSAREVLACREHRCRDRRRIAGGGRRGCHDRSPAVPSNVPGLPDGRVYEQVSPVDKYGNEAGAGTNASNFLDGAGYHYAVAVPDGNAVLFEGTGPMGESTAGYDLIGSLRSERRRAGTTRSALPREEIPTPPEGTLAVLPRAWLFRHRGTCIILFRSTNRNIAGAMSW